MELGWDQMAPRLNALFAPFSESEILIAGGQDENGQMLRDRILYDIKERSFRFLPEFALFEAHGNQSVQVAQDHVVGFVQRKNGDFVLMHHSK